jgi:cobalt-zinc-cadmium efflux system outer membrane protein
VKGRCAAVVLSVCVAAPAGAQDVAPGEGVSLTQAIALALAREPATRAARADVEIARGMSVQAGRRANPTLSFEHRQEPGGTDNTTDIGVEWPLELFRRAPRVALADANVSVAQHEEAEARRQLAAGVTVAYGEVAAASRQLSITDDVLAAATKQLELLRARSAEGAAPTLDRDIVDVEVRRIQAERAVQAGRVDRALVRLKRLLGVAPETPLRITQSLEELLPALTPEAASSPTRPDVQASEARVLAEEQRLFAAKSEGRPDVTMFGSYMRMDAGFPQRGFSPGGGLERIRSQFNYYTVGAMVTVPLFNRQQGSVAAAAAARDAAEARADASRLSAASEVAEARVWHEQAQRTVSLYEDGIRPLARRNLDTVRETYQLGRATVFDVLAEQRRYLETERSYTEALSDAYASRVSLGRARGVIP